MNGVVKFFRADLGWGFIRAEEKEYFVHRDNMVHDVLYIGQAVEFEEVKTERGVLAVNVTIRKD